MEEKTAEPKLNTYVKPIYDYYGKSNEYEKLKDKLWPQYKIIPGVEESDYRMWGTQALALKTYQFEQTDEATYNELYDKNLAIIKEELIKLLNSDFAKTKDWLLEKVAQQQQDVPLVVVKATERMARRDKSSDMLVEALASVQKNTGDATKRNIKTSMEYCIERRIEIEIGFHYKNK